MQTVEDLHAELIAAAQRLADRESHMDLTGRVEVFERLS